MVRRNLGIDLLGAPMLAPINGTEPAGYAAPPGTGPTGETCATCKFAARYKRYAKCRANEARWTNGPKTDIRLRMAACSKWEAA